MANRFRSTALAVLALGTLLQLANPAMATVLNRKTGAIVPAGDAPSRAKPAHDSDTQAGAAPDAKGATPTSASSGYIRVKKLNSGG